MISDDLAGWKATHDRWLTWGKRCRAATPTARRDQYDSWMRDVCDALDVDLPDPNQLRAVRAGAALVFSNLGVDQRTMQVAANVLGPLLAPWWEEGK